MFEQTEIIYRDDRRFEVGRDIVIQLIKKHASHHPSSVPREQIAIDAAYMADVFVKQIDKHEANAAKDREAEQIVADFKQERTN
jgi:hypothetical protein